MEIIDQHEFPIIIMSHNEEVMKQVVEYQHIQIPILPFYPSWERNRRYGKKYGKKYINEFKYDVEEMFKKGIDNTAMRFGPQKILEVLKKTVSQSVGPSLRE